VTTRENGNTKEETYSYMYNGHGDVTALLGADGTLAAGYYYDAFGNITEQAGTVNNNITYAGYQYDSTTDLYYLNARMYDAKTARFMQEDTYPGNAGDPLSLNLYTYCHNEPVMYTDPTGHYKEGDEIYSANVQKLLYDYGQAYANATKDEDKKNAANAAAKLRDYAKETKSFITTPKSMQEAIDLDEALKLTAAAKAACKSTTTANVSVNKSTTDAGRSTSADGGTTIGPAPTYQPTDTGMIMIDGKNYSIYVPGYANGTNTSLNAGSWVNTKTYTLSVYDFVVSKLFGTFGVSDPQDPGIKIEPNYVYSSRSGSSKTIVDEYSQGNKALKRGYGLQLLVSGIDAIGNSLESTPIKIIIQTNGNESRVIIQIGINGKILQSLAGDTLTIDNYDKDHDMRVTFDEKHKDDPYTGYLSINSEQKFVFTPKVYADDKVELGKDTFLSGWKTDVEYPDVLKRSQILDSSFHDGIINKVKKKLDKLR